MKQARSISVRSMRTPLGANRVQPRYSRLHQPSRRSFANGRGAAVWGKAEASGGCDARRVKTSSAFMASLHQDGPRQQWRRPDPGTRLLFVLEDYRPYGLVTRV
ncbi:hypothetical protein D3C77_570700 [compost metagenome]